MFVIYGMPDCIWCDRAKALLKLNDKEVIYKDITEAQNYEEMQSVFPGAKTVPQIYHETYDNPWGLPDKVLIGGYEQLREYLK